MRRDEHFEKKVQSIAVSFVSVSIAICV